MKIQDNCFLITGGASGLGLATALHLASKGARIGILDLNRADGIKAQTLIGEQAFFVETDVTSELSAMAAISQCEKRFGRINGLINCAGIAPPSKVLSKEMEPHSLELFEKVIKINLIGSFNLARLVAKSIASHVVDNKNDNGIIINTASVAAFEGQIGQSAYSASKGGLVSLMLPMARELARFGIRVMTIAPGIFKTPMLAGLPQKAQESLGEQVPFPSRLGEPEEYAHLCGHIIENCYLNGETIRLDGAIRMASK